MRWILLILVVFSTQVEASRLRTFLGGFKIWGKAPVSTKIIKSTPWYTAWSKAHELEYNPTSSNEINHEEPIEGEVLTPEERAKINLKKMDFEGAQVYYDGKFYYIPSRIVNNNDPFDIDEKD